MENNKFSIFLVGILLGALVGVGVSILIALTFLP
jgi:gas vesicle protein